MRSPGSGMNKPPRKKAAPAEEAAQEQPVPKIMSGMWQSPVGTKERVTVDTDHDDPEMMAKGMYRVINDDGTKSYIPEDQFKRDDLASEDSTALDSEPETPNEQVPDETKASASQPEENTGASRKEKPRGGFMERLMRKSAAALDKKIAETPPEEVQKWRDRAAKADRMFGMGPKEGDTPKERSTKERGKLAQMITQYKELMKAPERHAVELKPQEEITQLREGRAQEFAEKYGFGERRRELKELASQLQEEYTKFYKNSGPLAYAKERLEMKPETLATLERKFAADSWLYGRELQNKLAEQGAGDMERKRAIAFGLRDTVSGREELRIAAREAAQSESQKKWYYKALGYAGKGVKFVADKWQQGTETAGRAVAASLAMRRGENAETLDRVKFENDARFYTTTARLFGSAAIGAAAFSATPLAALGFGGNVAWRVARGTIGMVAGQRIGRAAINKMREVDAGQELKEFRSKDFLTASDLLRFQDSYRKHNVAARRGRRALVGTAAAFAGGAGATGAITLGEAGGIALFENREAIGGAVASAARSTAESVGSAAESAADRMGSIHIPVPDLTPESATEAGSATPIDAPPAPGAPVTPEAGTEAGTATPAASGAPSETAPAQPPSAAEAQTETPRPQTEARPQDAAPAREGAATPAAPAAPGEQAPAQPSAATPEAPAATPEAVSRSVEVVAERGDGYDRMFSALREQLREQYGDTPPEQLPPTVQHIMNASHENVLSREFGLAWGDATDNSASAPVEIGDSLRVEDGKLILERADGSEQEFMNAEGERVYDYETGETREAAATTAPETPRPEAAAAATEPTAPSIEATETAESAPSVPDVPPRPAAEVPPPAPRAPVTVGGESGEVVRETPTVGEQPRTLREVMEGRSVAETAPALNAHGHVIDPTARTLFEWDMPGTERNSLFAFGDTNREFLERQARLNPGQPILFEARDTTALGVETREVRGIMMGEDGSIREIPREVTNRIPVPNPDDFIRVVSR